MTDKEIDLKGKKGVPMSFWTDVADALVNKDPHERETPPAMWERLYGRMWPADPPYPPNALKIYNLAGTWAFNTWDEEKNLPGEKLIESLAKGQYNSWDNSGNYILDTLNQATSPSDSNIAPPGTAKYRPKPDEPGYSGPYTTRA